MQLCEAENFQKIETKLVKRNEKIWKPQSHASLKSETKRGWWPDSWKQQSLFFQNFELNPWITNYDFLSGYITVDRLPLN